MKSFPDYQTIVVSCVDTYGLLGKTFMSQTPADLPKAMPREASPRIAPTRTATSRSAESRSANEQRAEPRTTQTRPSSDR